jgi:undecaprenyl diphosphate synthase
MFKFYWKKVSLENQIQADKIPQHVAIIMDGNGRWAKKQGFLRARGHKSGVDALRKVATLAAKKGVRYLTVYAFSSENWSRPKAEVNALMSLLVSSLKKELGTLQKNEISLNAIGDLQSLPEKCQHELEEVRQITSGNSRMTLTLALSYGSKSEMLTAVKALAQEVKEGTIALDDIGEKDFEKHLFTANMPDPDLLIRTSGEHRISNYLLWQIAYAELYFTDTLWPDFDEEDFYKALLSYQNRERRYGKTSEQLNP